MRRGAGIGVVLLLTLVPAVAMAQDTGSSVAPDVSWMGVVLLVAVPLLLVLASAFVKVAVVLGLLRSGLGARDVPPPLVVTALAALLSVLVMAPVIEKVVEEVGPDPEVPGNLEDARNLFERTSDPVLTFLEDNTSAETQERFAEIVTETTRKDQRVETRRLDVLLPAFVATELKEAFQLGFLLLLPFLVLDIVVAAFLQGAGLASVSSTMVALPFKLILFVLVDGWRLLLEGLLLGYS